MVSDYKFHLFRKRLKKEKWRPNRDLSMPSRSIFHLCCVAAAPPRGSTEGPLRAGRFELLGLWDSTGAVCGKSEHSHEVLVSQKFWHIPSGREFEDSQLLQCHGQNHESSNARVCMGPGRHHCKMKSLNRGDP